jgi:hypothetical protein
MNTATTATTARAVRNSRATGASMATQRGDNKPTAQDLGDLGTNLRAAMEGDELVIRINLSERHGKSASGKTTIVATSSGNQKVPGSEVVIGINAYVKP